jgi:7,8-dihydroneopterin aldolase/epimerase/oxygenase
MSKITLKNMEFHAYHGCMEHEQQVGNTFLVTVSIETDTEKAEKSDHLEDTLNYKSVYDVIKTEMEQPSKLIEHVAYRIRETVMHKFPEIKKINVKLSKLNPPLGGKSEKVSIELKAKR